MGFSLPSTSVSMAILITSPGLVTTGTEGADDIRFNSAAITGNGSVVNGLAGNDTILATDVITVSAANIGAAASINAGGGADSISYTGNGSTDSASNVIILGGAGRDTITVASGAFSNVGGGDGGDLINLEQATYSSIGAGGGLDTI